MVIHIKFFITTAFGGQTGPSDQWYQGPIFAGTESSKYECFAKRDQKANAQTETEEEDEGRCIVTDFFEMVRRERCKQSVHAECNS